MDVWPLLHGGRGLPLSAAPEAGRIARNKCTLIANLAFCSRKEAPASPASPCPDNILVSVMGLSCPPDLGVFSFHWGPKSIWCWTDTSFQPALWLARSGCSWELPQGRGGQPRQVISDVNSNSRLVLRAVPLPSGRDKPVPQVSPHNDLDIHKASEIMTSPSLLLFLKAGLEQIRPSSVFSQWH